MPARPLPFAKQRMSELLEMLTAEQEQAAHLLGLWHRLAGQHIALGCSCTMGGISVTLEDFERDIADYFLAESERLGQAETVQFLQADGPLNLQERAVRNILERLQQGDAPPSVAQWLLPRMTQTIESYIKLHGPAPEAPLMGGSGAWRRAYRD
jgi:hypothetical protein